MALPSADSDAMSAFGAVLHHVMDAAGFAVLVIDADGVHIAGADQNGSYLIDGERADDGGPATQATQRPHGSLQ